MTTYIIKQGARIYHNPRDDGSNLSLCGRVLIGFDAGWQVSEERPSGAERCGHCYNVARRRAQEAADRRKR